MNAELPKGAFRAGFFSTVADAERAVDGLLAADFSVEQLAIVCPDKFRGELSSRLTNVETPAEHSPAHIAEGASIGAALGGIALGIATLATGGLLFVPSALVLIGGGAMVGGFSNLIASEGYRRGIDEYFAQAHATGQIVVGVTFDGDSAQRNRDAATILRGAGATSLVPDDDPTLPAAATANDPSIAAQRVNY